MIKWNVDSFSSSHFKRTPSIFRPVKPRERFIYRSAHLFSLFPVAEKADRSEEYVNRSQKHEWRNWD
jgi:hypothetical protein